MELTKWTPRTTELGPPRFFDRFFDDFFAPSFGRETLLADQGWNPAVDIYEREGHTIIKADLPGVDKKDIEVKLEGRILTLRGTRTSDEEVKEGSYYRHEIFSGTFERSFTLDEGIDQDKIKAEYKDGVLRLEIPKTLESKAKRIAIH
jgi:HSP20 family protein